MEDLCANWGAEMRALQLCGAPRARHRQLSGICGAFIRALLLTRKQPAGAAERGLPRPTLPLLPPPLLLLHDDDDDDDDDGEGGSFGVWIEWVRDGEDCEDPLHFVTIWRKLASSTALHLSVLNAGMGKVMPLGVRGQPSVGEWICLLEMRTGRSPGLRCRLKCRLLGLNP